MKKRNIEIGPVEQIIDYVIKFKQLRIAPNIYPHDKQ